MENGKLKVESYTCNRLIFHFPFSTFHLIKRSAVFISFNRKNKVIYGLTAVNKGYLDIWTDFWLNGLESRISLSVCNAVAVDDGNIWGITVDHFSCKFHGSVYRIFGFMCKLAVVECDNFAFFYFGIAEFGISGSVCDLTCCSSMYGWKPSRSAVLILSSTQQEKDPTTRSSPGIY